MEVEGGGPELPGSSPALWQGPCSPPEVDKAGGSAPSKTDCHAYRLAEEPLPHLELCPALVQGEGALKAGSPRSSSLEGWRGGWGHQCPLPPQG